MALIKGNYIVEIKILQNGFPLKEVDIPLKSRGLYSITNHPSDLLGIILYPLYREIPILEIGKNQIELLIDHAWEGFVSSKGKITNIKGSKALGSRIELHAEDYASVTWHDLRLLVSVRKPKKKVKSTVLPRGNFLASPFSTLINGSYEWTSNICSAFVCAILIAAGMSALTKIEFDKPKDFSELPPSESLSFIHPANLFISPELLQEHLDITKPISSTLNWYSNYLSNAFSWKQTSTIVEHKIIGEKARQQLDDFHVTIDKIKENYDSAADSTTRSPISSQIKAPIIIGPTFSQRALAVLNRMDIITESARVRLSTKREIIGKFIAEPTYQWENYQRKDIKKLPGNTELVPPPKAVVLGPEQEMYEKFQKMADQAQQLQDSFVPAYNDQKLLTQANGLMLKASPGILGLNENPIPTINLTKLKYMPVSAFGAKAKALKPIEPLSGFVDNNALKLALVRQKMEIQLCYEASLRRNLSYKGKMVWEWVLDTEGNISDIELVSSEIPDNELARCIRRKIAIFTLPKAKRGSVKISHIFEFRPEKNL